MNAGSSVLLALFAFACSPSFQAAPLTYCGSTPADSQILKLLQIESNPAPELIQWNLALYRDSDAAQPSRYDLRCTYGATTPGQPGLGASTKTLERSGTCVITRGTKFNPNATVLELSGAVSLYQLDSNLFHILTPDRALMNGHGGWSYTLNSTARSEKPVDPALALTVPDMSYQIAPLATGPNVFAVFEGRTPAQGIAQQLKIPVHAAATKAKWRVTLYQDPDAKTPATFKIEGTFFRPAAREGKWKMIAASADQTIYELTFNDAGVPLRLLKGDDNVLFFLDAESDPMVGHCDFSYTLNRRTAVPSVSQATPK